MDITLLSYAFDFIVGVVLLWLGGIQYKVRQMEKDIALCARREEVRELIQDKLEAHVVQLIEIKKDIEKIDNKLDRLIEKP